MTAQYLASPVCFPGRDRGMRRLAQAAAETGAGRVRRRSRTVPVVTMLALVAALAGCGKKGPTEPAGPPDQITYPKVYPTR